MGPGQQENELAVCGPCHARREAFSQQSAPVGARLSNHYNLSLLTPDLYFADGQQREEVFILGSFLQSKMKAKGVTCSNCHEPHSGELVAEGDAVCTQCHNESGNTAFPTLARKNYDLPSHHHHTPGTEAAACVSCHMPDRAYMMIDKRRDHFFRRPDPRQSAAAGAPDACTQCHQDQSQAWAAEQIDAWFPDADKSWQDRGPLVAFMSGDRSESAVEALTRYVEDISRPAIVRATAADVLGESGIAADRALTEKLIGDNDDLVRSAAAKLLRSSPDDLKISLLTPLLTDPASAVRQAAARELAGTGLEKIPEADRPAFSKALNEYMASRGANADMPESHMALGGLALSMRSWGNAEAAFKLATDLDPQLADGWLILARLREALGDQAGAEKYLSVGLERSPADMALMFERAAFEARRGSIDNAVDWYRRIVSLYPRQTEGWLGLANAALQIRNPSLALDASAKALELSPTNADALLLRAAAYYRLGDQTKAKETALAAKKASPTLQLPAELEKLIQQD
jgi:predicted CXXCH cytochrome family protein